MKVLEIREVNFLDSRTLLLSKALQAEPRRYKRMNLSFIVLG